MRSFFLRWSRVDMDLKSIALCVSALALSVSGCIDTTPSHRDAAISCDPDDDDDGGGSEDGGGGASDGGGAKDGGGTTSDAGGSKDGGNQPADAGGDTSTTGDTGTTTDAGGSTDDGGDTTPDGSVTGNPSGTWANVTGSLANTASECGNVTYIAAHPTSSLVVVGVATKGLYATTDGAKTWNRLGTGTGSDTIKSRVSRVLFDPAAPNTFYTSGIYGESDGIYKTTDNGMTFKRVGDVGHNDSLDVDFSDPQRKVMLAGTHEQPKIVYRSTDSGANWMNIGTTLPNDYQTAHVHIVDAMTYLVGCSSHYGDKKGIFRTTNGGTSWTQVAMAGGGAHPLAHSDGSIYWVSRSGDGMVRSTDKGATWKTVTGPNVIYGITPVELPDGRIAAYGQDGILVSSDHGVNWTKVAPSPPWDFSIAGFTYSVNNKAFYATRWTCDPETAVPKDAIQKFSWDYATNK